MKLRAKVLLALLIGLLALGCNRRPSGADPGDVLADVARNLGKIKSGELDFKLASIREGGEGEVGFTIRGPFALAESGKLPVADLEYTQLAGPEKATSRFISTGDAAFAGIDEKIYELPDAQEDKLRGSSSSQPGRALEDVRIESWLRSPNMTEEGDEYRITSDLNPTETINGILDIAGRFGSKAPAGLTRIEGDEAARIEKAVKSSSIEMVAGKKDKLLRRLEMHIEFESDPEALGTDLGRLKGVSIVLEMQIDELNQPVEVSEPEDALPASQFPGSR